MQETTSGRERRTALKTIKLLHTGIWALLAGCILALPFAAWAGAFRLAAILSAAVWIECLVLVANGWRCPLTAVAAQYTEDREPDFDIYLPRWLAEHNKAVFGVLFVVNEILVAWMWMRRG